MECPKATVAARAASDGRSPGTRNSAQGVAGRAAPVPTVTVAESTQHGMRRDSAQALPALARVMETVALSAKGYL